MSFVRARVIIDCVFSTGENVGRAVVVSDDQCFEVLVVIIVFHDSHSEWIAGRHVIMDWFDWSCASVHLHGVESHRRAIVCDGR